MYETFEEWFDVFMEECQKLDYMGPVDADSFLDNFENEDCPYDTAAEFVREMNE